MINSHYLLSRGGDAQMWWTGSREELASFKAWVEEQVPSNAFGWFSEALPFRKWPNNDFEKTHLAGRFQLSAWVFLTYWWSGGKIGLPGKWKLSKGKAQY